MDRRLLPVFALLLAACGEVESTDAQAPTTAPPDAPPATWQARVELVRADLQQLELAHQAKDEAAVLASWELAYLEHFEPLLERPLAGVADPHAVMAVEYHFGRLLSACESPREGPFTRAVTDLEQALATLQQHIAQLPPPTAG